VLEVLLLVCWAVPSGLVLLRLLGAPSSTTASLLLAPSLGVWLHAVVHGALVAVGAYTPSLAAGLSTAVAGASLLMVRLRLPVTKDNALPFARRRTGLLIGTMLLSLLPLVDAWMSPFPHGVDWVGFSVLALHLQERGAMVALNGQVWSYPPGFVALASSTSWLTGQAVWSSARWVGNAVLAALLLGLAGAFHRQGAGPHAVLASLLGVGLAAKVWDGGWPTVASLLVLPTAVAILLERERPTRTRGMLAVVAVLTLLVHPAGALLLGALLTADVIVPVSSSDETRRRRLQVLMLVLLPTGFVLRALGPSTMEDGWQGGRAMVLWGGVLLPFAALAAYRLRRVREASLLTVWYVLVWGLSLVHVLPASMLVGVVHAVASATYAMALYAFVVPAAGLMALHWSPATHFAVEGVPRRPFVLGGDPHLPQRLGFVLMFVVFLGAALATALVAQLSHHDELLAVDADDFAVADALHALAGDAPVLVEQAPWGEAMSLAGLNTSTGPDVGVHDGQPTLHAQAIQAVLTDDATRLRDLGVEWAITSPRGALGWMLERSPWWEVVHTSGAARAWHLRTTPDAAFAGAVTIDGSSCAAAAGCSLRSEPWSGQRWQDPHQLGPMRATVDGSSILLLEPPPSVSLPASYSVCLHVERLGTLSMAAVGVGDAVLDLAGPAGHELVCTTSSMPSTLDVEVEVRAAPWVDPSAVSGRGDRLFEHGGLRFHAITLHLL
jgi:hypothetical protein